MPTDPEERAARAESMARISAGSGADNRTPARRRAQAKAKGFKENAQLERLIEMREKQPDKYDSLSPSFRMAVGFYESAKKAAEDIEGGDAA
jgi:hypothetical protein